MTSPIEAHKGQKQVWECDSRFIMLCCGRRWGKTFLAIEKLLQASDKYKSLNVYMAPTRQQGKDVIWRDLKARISQLGWRVRVNEAELKITRRNRSRIVIRTAEKPERLRGLGINCIVLDEFAEYRNPHIWNQIIRPCLSDTIGKAYFIFTPKGYNNAYELYQEAKTKHDWNTFSFKTIDSPFFQTEEGKIEIEDARATLPARDFKQEYEAEFMSFAGLIYYAFNREKCHIDYDFKKENGPIYLGADFNRSPMAWTLFQKVEGKLIQFDEVFIKFSNTEECCKLVKQKYPNHEIIIRPDATGKRKTTNSSLSDFDIIRNMLTSSIQTDSLNPRIVDRWASVNRAFEKDLVKINVNKCKNTTRDLETLTYKEGSCVADLSDPMAGHITDALGYCVYREFPILQQRRSKIIQL